VSDNQNPDVTGEELHLRFLAGDKGAFEELVRLYERELSMFIRGMVHDTYETKHLVIDTFAELAVSGGNFEGRSTLKTYLFVIAKNLTIKLLKNRERENHLSIDDVFRETFGETESPGEFLEREENKTLLLAAMLDLKPDYQMVLQLLYFEDMSYREAGKVMKKTERQIEGLAYRAKAALKKKLESEGLTYV